MMKMSRKIFCDVCGEEIKGEYIYIYEGTLAKIYDVSNHDRDGELSLVEEEFCSRECLCEALMKDAK